MQSTLLVCPTQPGRVAEEAHDGVSSEGIRQQLQTLPEIVSPTEQNDTLKHLKELEGLDTILVEVLSSNTHTLLVLPRLQDPLFFLSVSHTSQ